MTDAFAHETLGQRLLFGTGLAETHLAAEVARLGASRIMVIASKRTLPLVSRLTAGLPVALVFDEVVQHVPVEVAERARAAAEASGADLLVCIGGGSATGLAKAVALTTGFPIVAVATTYAGSEATNVWGLTESSRKTTGVDARVLPVTVIADAALTVDLPVALSVASGLNALAHCVDSLWAPRADPLNAVHSLEGARNLAAGLRLVVADPQGLEGRSQSLLGSYLAAIAFASAGSGLHHKICHVLGGAYNLPHAETHSVVLAYVLAFNGPAAPDASQKLAAALGSTTALGGLQSLRADLAAPPSLRALVEASGDSGNSEPDGNTGASAADAVRFGPADIPAAARMILEAVPPSNPRAVSALDLERLLAAAWEGTDPREVDFQKEEQ